MNTVKQSVGLDHESRHRLDLAVEEKHVGIDVRAAIIVMGGGTTRNREVVMESAKRLSLPKTGLGSTEPSRL
jgi:hypothetical protein